ncbi:PhoD-like phosphatase-domain-containing protein [Chaetomium tenue]|uniref:PhoD-like phosphatase-domain-containing protein n=1 Tax=Chaetomium tenue TaxID=1854479 RepID=A0ACB7PGK1_9PEZI|nr:PhoD-like phosphatase-domain-containing protein [Chaetomium globosum]
MLALAAPACLALVFFFRKWRAWRAQRWVRGQLDVANFHYAPDLEGDLQERLRLRATENRRLKVAFGIENSLTTTSPSVHSAFLKTASGVLNRRGRNWEELYGIAKAFLKAEVEAHEAAGERSLRLAESVRCMVLAVVLFDSFGMDATTIPRSDLVTITTEINKQWLRSKSHPTDVTPSELLNSTIASLNITSRSPGAEHTALSPVEVLGLLMPQYETLWRVVLLTFVTAYHHQPAADADAAQRTATVPSCLGDPSLEREALKLAKEGLRLYPSNKHLYRTALPTTDTPSTSTSTTTPITPTPLPTSPTSPITAVSASLTTLHRHPLIWGPNPTTFRPSRFDTTALTPAQRQAYVPFSVKPHRCPAAGGFGERMVVVLVVALGRGWGRNNGDGRGEGEGGDGEGVDGNGKGTRKGVVRFGGDEGGRASLTETDFVKWYSAMPASYGPASPLHVPGRPGSRLTHISEHVANPRPGIGLGQPHVHSPMSLFREHDSKQHRRPPSWECKSRGLTVQIRPQFSAMLYRLGLGALVAASLVEASFERNLAYSSPSRRHPSLAVPLAHVNKRQTGDVYAPAEVNFTHGVASGDPYADSVILWTRLAPTTESVASDLVPGGVVPIYDDSEGAQPSSKAACVEFKIATDLPLSNVVDQGRAFTTSDVDYTVKASPLGRTKTIPSKTQKVDRNINLAVYSCSNYPEGYFNAYANPVRKESVDYVLHLGDYIYEYKPDSSIASRNPQPDREIYTLFDYRTRLGSYRTDPDLLASHAKFAWIPVWDDHEVANNAWRNGSSNSDGEVFRARKQAAVRAYFEWMPLRQADMDDSLRIWRSFSLGTLLDLVMLDTRQYDRDLTVLNGLAGIGGNSQEVEKLVDLQNRTIMGFEQEAWFYDQLTQSSNRGAAWRLIGNQVIFSRMTLGILGDQPFNRDQWDGYLANRDRVYQHLADGKINNTVMLSGDSHAAWVSDLAWLGKRDYDETTGEGAFGVELAGTAVTSSSPVGGLPKLLAKPLSEWLISKNPELQWQDLFYRGYFEMSIGYEAIEAKFYGIPDVKVKSDDEILLATFLINNGENKLARNPTVGGGRAKGGALKNGKVPLV